MISRLEFIGLQAFEVRTTPGQRKKHHLTKPTHPSQLRPIYTRPLKAVNLSQEPTQYVVEGFTPGRGHVDRGQQKVERPIGSEYTPFEVTRLVVQGAYRVRAGQASLSGVFIRVSRVGRLRTSVCLSVCLSTTISST